MAADPRFADIHTAFARSFARTVAGVAAEDLAAAPPTAAAASALAAAAGRPLPTDPRATLRACIEAVWRSWRSPRAIAYRHRHHIDGLAGTAVSIQAMFPSEVSGVVFTVDPQAPESGELVIEAAFGLGESVVSGDVTPDAYRVARAGSAVLRSVVGRKTASVRALGDRAEHPADARCLDEARLAELAALCLRVEQHRGSAVDIEFGFAEGRFAILQSRPIRGLEVARDVAPARLAMVETLRAGARGGRRLWIRHNLDETLSHPTTLTWDFIRRFMAGDGGFGRLYRDLGYRQDPRLATDGFLDCIGGRLYADTGRAAGLFWDRMPLAYDLDALRRDPKLIEQPPTVFRPELADQGFLVRLPGNLWAMIRASRRLKRLRGKSLARFRDEVLPAYETWLTVERVRDLDALAVPALLACLEARRARVLDDFAGESLKPGFFGSMAFAAVCADLVQVLGDQAGRELALRLIMGLEGDLTVELNAELHAVAHGNSSIEGFLDRFGHRAVAEMELAEPRWREESGYLERQLDGLRRQTIDPAERHREHAAARVVADQSLPEVLAAHGGASLVERIRSNLGLARELLPWRENGKFHLMRGYELVRQAVLALGRRLDLGESIFNLHYDELAEAARDPVVVRARIAERSVRREAQRRFDMPDLIDSADLDALGLPRRIDAANEWVGEPISAGIVTGTARLVFHPDQAGELGDDAILVCPSTDPAWTALFARVRGLIIERGGVLSHGAIVARDFGLPAVVCPDATRLIADGQRLLLDGNTGRITLLPAEVRS